MSVFDDVKKLPYTSDVHDVHDGIVDVDMKGSLFGKSLMFVCVLSKYKFLNCVISIYNHT